MGRSLASAAVILLALSGAGGCRDDVAVQTRPLETAATAPSPSLVETRAMATYTGNGIASVRSGDTNQDIQLDGETVRQLEVGLRYELSLLTPAGPLQAHEPYFLRHVRTVRTLIGTPRSDGKTLVFDTIRGASFRLTNATAETLAAGRAGKATYDLSSMTFRVEALLAEGQGDAELLSAEPVSLFECVLEGHAERPPVTLSLTSIQPDAQTLGAQLVTTVAGSTRSIATGECLGGHGGYECTLAAAGGTYGSLRFEVPAVEPGTAFDVSLIRTETRRSRLAFQCTETDFRALASVSDE